jgi:selenocysteine lyase/cysteine desulfurase
MVILGKDFLPEPFCEGGNGVDSLSGLMPAESPERYEAGTMPTPAIAGLCEGLKWVMARGVESIHAHEVSLYHRAKEALGNLRGVTLYAPMYAGAVLSFNVDGMPSERTAGLLNEKGICTRGGYHCTALGHKTLGTPEGGAVRASFGAMNTAHDVDALVDAVHRIVRET